MSTEAEQTEQLKPATELGLARWVQATFLLVAAIVFLVGGRLISFVWQYFAEPDDRIVTAGAAGLAIAVGLGLYRAAPVFNLVNDAIGELSKVTWPSREETRVATIVVIITSIVAAILIGALDALWSALTDFIYKV